jgi:hypothetical protein
MWVEDISWPKLISALLNAFIMGDVSVTNDGRYHLSAPVSSVPVIQVPKGDQTIELEPDWNIRGKTRPQVGADEPKQKPRIAKSWGTREVALYLRQETGRRISLPILRQLLSILEIPKGENTRWNFRGATDPAIQTIKDAIENGTYDTLLREGTSKARAASERNKQKLEALESARTKTKNARKSKHLKQLRKIENQ